MGRGPPLTEKERGQIEGLSRAGWRERAIAKEVHRSRGCVREALRRANAVSERKPLPPAKPRGPKPKWSLRLVRRLVRKASEGHHSAAQLKHELDLPVGVRTTRRLLAGVDFLAYEKMDKEIELTPAHKAARLAWATANVTNSSDQWAKVIFSDEKKFNLDGPDGMKSYWRDLRRPTREVKKRQMGGGSVMVWGAVSTKGKSALAVLVGRQASADYVWTVSEFLLPFAHLHYGTEFIYQQDNASIHVSRESMAFFEEQGVEIMEWPARSPDLNPIENVWAALSRAIYTDGTQYENVHSLKTAILNAWEALIQEDIVKLMDSMPR